MLCYADLTSIALDDRKFLDNLSEEYWVDWTEVDISEHISFAIDTHMAEHKVSTYITNSIIYETMCEIVDKRVSDEEDKETLKNSIVADCLMSWFNCDSDELHTQEAKDLCMEF